MLKIIIKGKVQGVFFRTNIEKIAKELDIRGYTKNIEDGVKVIAQGKPEALSKLIEFCKTGPKGAVITDLIITQEPELDYPDFQIEH